MKKWLQVLLIGLIMIAATTPTFARGYHVAEERNRNSANIISEQQAVAIAQQHFRGRLLAISRAGNHYRVKLLSDHGAIHTILINAQTGAIVSTR